MTRQRLNYKNSCEGAASLFVIFAIFLLIGLQTELAYRYMTRSQTIKVLRQRFREEEDLHQKAAENLRFAENSSNILFKGSSYLYFNKPEGIFALPAPLFVRKKDAPLILWRNFLSGETLTGTCGNLNSNCNLEYRGVVRSYGDIKVNNLELISQKNISADGSATDYKNSAALGTLGSAKIQGSLSLKSENQSPSLFIIAAYNDIHISELQIAGSNSIILFYSGSGTVNLPSLLPDHANCLQNSTNYQQKVADRPLPIILISASKAYTGQLELKLEHYENCIKDKIMEWFPEEKLVGFSRR